MIEVDFFQGLINHIARSLMAADKILVRVLYKTQFTLGYLRRDIGKVLSEFLIQSSSSRPLVR